MRLARLFRPASGTCARRTKRRRPGGRWRRRAFIAALALVVFGGAAGGIWQAARSGWIAAQAAELRDALLAASGRAGLRIDEVLVEGRNQTERAQLLAALDVTLGMPMLAFDPEAARARIEQLGWVRRAAVARRLPNLIYVRIEERRPIALWQHRGRHFLIDQEGVVIRDRDDSRFDRLPKVVGEGAPGEAATLLDLLTGFPAIARQVEAAVFVSQRRWNLRLANGIDVRLPEHGVGAALGWLADVDRDHKLLDRDIVAVDLRQPDRMIVRMEPAAARRARGEENT